MNERLRIDRPPVEKTGESGDRWVFKRRGMTVVVQQNRDHEVLYDFDPEKYIGAIDFTPQGFRSEYSARILSGLNSMNEFFGTMSDGRIRPDVLVSDTNIEMALTAKALGFAVSDRAETDETVLSLNRYRITGNTDDVEKAVLALQEKTLPSGKLFTTALSERNTPIVSSPTAPSVPFTMMTALGQNGAEAARWLHLIKAGDSVLEQNLVVFGMQSPEEEAKPEKLFGYRTSPK